MPSGYRNQKSRRRMHPELERLLYQDASCLLSHVVLGYPVTPDCCPAPQTDGPPARTSRHEAPKPTLPESTESAPEKLSPELARLLGSRADSNSSSGRYSYVPSANPKRLSVRPGPSGQGSFCQPSAKPAPAPSKPKVTRPKATVESDDEADDGT